MHFIQQHTHHKIKSFTLFLQQRVPDLCHIRVLWHLLYCNITSLVKAPPTENQTHHCTKEYKQISPRKSVCSVCVLQLPCKHPSLYGVSVIFCLKHIHLKPFLSLVLFKNLFLFDLCHVNPHLSCILLGKESIRFDENDSESRIGVFQKSRVYFQLNIRRHSFWCSSIPDLLLCEKESACEPCWLNPHLKSL